jgi:hypothetical protein
MGAKSEFQRVLEMHLRPGSVPGSDIPNNKQSVLGDSFLNHIKFTFSQIGKPKTTVAYPKKERPAQEKIAGLHDSVHTQQVRPTLERRILTVDQRKALKVFSKFSRQTINDYSTDEEIKSAYRRLAKIYHPDFNKNGAEEFKIISLAYNKLIK